MFNIKAICVVYLILINIKAGDLKLDYKTPNTGGSADHAGQELVCIQTNDMKGISEDWMHDKNKEPPKICCNGDKDGNGKLTKDKLVPTNNDNSKKYEKLDIGFHNKSEDGEKQKKLEKKLKKVLNAAPETPSDSVLAFNFQKSGKEEFIKVLLAMGIPDKNGLRTQTIFANCQIKNATIDVEIFLDRTTFYLTDGSNSASVEINSGDKKQKIEELKKIRDAPQNAENLLKEYANKDPSGKLGSNNQQDEGNLVL